ncbi:MAG: hypothetical protein DRJ15_16145, partial [Bacteroidetes bacterium]
DDQLLLAKEGCEYKDARIVGTEKIIGYEFTDAVDSLPMRFFDIDCAETRELLCFNLKITRYWSKFLRQWVVTDKEQTIVKPCTTQEEISEAINEVALAIMRERAE